MILSMLVELYNQQQQQQQQQQLQQQQQPATGQAPLSPEFRASHEDQTLAAMIAAKQLLELQHLGRQHPQQQQQQQPAQQAGQQPRPQQPQQVQQQPFDLSLKGNSHDVSPNTSTDGSSSGGSSMLAHDLSAARVPSFATSAQRLQQALHQQQLQAAELLAYAKHSPGASAAGLASPRSEVGTMSSSGSPDHLLLDMQHMRHHLGAAHHHHSLHGVHPQSHHHHHHHLSHQNHHNHMHPMQHQLKDTNLNINLSSSPQLELSLSAKGSPAASPPPFKAQPFKIIRDKDNNFSCQYCSKKYQSMGALKMHVRTHTLPCQCKICGKSFSRPWLLQGHIRTHTGEKPFKCDQCHRAFADRSNLRAHLQTHAKVKKYSCKFCLKTFSRMSLQVKHEEHCNVHATPSQQQQPQEASSAPSSPHSSLCKQELTDDTDMDMHVDEQGSPCCATQQEPQQEQEHHDQD